MSYTMTPEFRKNTHLDRSRENQGKLKCSLFTRCEGCPYPNHGFICWSRDGHCMREIMKKLYEGDEENDDKRSAE